MLERYKAWVKRHPGVVQNLDWLLYFTVWNPGRIGGSEYGYEAYHAAVGLLSLWHQNVLEEDALPTSRPAPYLWLDALEQVETLIELRAMHLERQGKMSRYGPLLVLEAAKALLKMSAWGRYAGHVFLRRPSPDDLHQFESELGFQDVLASLERLRIKYTSPAKPAGAQPQPPPQQHVPHVQDAQAQPVRSQHSPVGHSAGAAAADATASGAAAASGAADSGPHARSAGAPGRSQGGGGAAAVAAPEITPASSAGMGGECVAATAAAPDAAAGCATGDAAAAASRTPLPSQYGVRQYVEEGLGWLRSLAPARSSGCRSGRCGGGGCGAGGGGGGGGGSSAHGRGQEAHAGGDCGSSRCGGCAVCSGGGGAADADADAARRASCASCGPSPRCCCGSSGSARPVPTEAAAAAEASARAGGGGSSSGLDAGEAEHSEERMGRNLLWLAELLAIWRPVVYVGMLKRYGRRSWRPWFTSLAIDLLSLHFHSRGRKHLAAAAAAVKAAAAAAGEAGPHGNSGGSDNGAASRPPPGAGTSLLSLALARSLAAPGAAPGEDRELYERRRKLLLYGLRSPFLEAATLSWLLAARNATARVPLVGFAADYLYGLVDTFTAYYCYTSGSN